MSEIESGANAKALIGKRDGFALPLSLERKAALPQENSFRREDPPSVAGSALRRRCGRTPAANPSKSSRAGPLARRQECASFAQAERGFFFRETLNKIFLQKPTWASSSSVGALSLPGAETRSTLSALFAFALSVHRGAAEGQLLPADLQWLRQNSSTLRRSDFRKEDVPSAKRTDPLVTSKRKAATHSLKRSLRSARGQEFLLSSKQEAKGASVSVCLSAASPWQFLLRGFCASLRSKSSHQVVSSRALWKGCRASAAVLSP